MPLECASKFLPSKKKKRNKERGEESKWHVYFTLYCKYAFFICM